MLSSGRAASARLSAASLAAAYTLAGGPTYVANMIVAAELPTMGIILVMMVIFLIMVTYIPILSTWLPATFMGPEIITH